MNLDNVRSSGRPPLKGVIAAALLPFNEDLSIDEPGTRRHLRKVASTPGLAGVTVNGHSMEVHACTPEEQRRVLALALEEIGDATTVICGVYADGSTEAARIARGAEREGADALLVFPPQSMAMGGQLRPEMALRHFAAIAELTDLPLIVFEYPSATGLGYGFETLMRMFEELPTICAVKDWCGDPMAHERNIRTFQTLPRPVSVLSAHTSWLLSSLAAGPDGVLSGSGSVIADRLVALFAAMCEEDDLDSARRIYDGIHPLTEAFYAPPVLDMHNRMKTCLSILGELSSPAVRPPLCELGEAEVARLEYALNQAGMLVSAG